MKKLIYILPMLILLFGYVSNSPDKKKNEERFPMGFMGTVYEVEKLDFPYQHICIVRMNNMRI